MGAILHQLISASFPSSQYDSDAQAYFNAVSTAGVTLNSTQKDAFNTFVLACKSASIWTKFYALYPFIGATAATHAINAKSPGTYNITWSGTVAHSSNGVTGDGSTGYGDTGFSGVSSSKSIFSVSASFYSRTVSSNGNYIEFGAYSSDTKSFNGGCGRTGSNRYFDASSGGGGWVSSFSSDDSSGHFIGSRESSSYQAIYRNGVLKDSDSNTISGTSAYPNYNVHFLRLNPHGYYSNRQISFFHFGDGLTSSECSSLYTAVQTLQTSLGRNV